MAPDPKTLPFVEEYLLLESIDSTNSYCKALARYPQTGITVVRAQVQTAGRGQKGNSFFSSVPGGLWVSLVIAVADIGTHFVYNRALGLAIAEAVEAAGCGAVRIKWPNDIWCGKLKICGILLETVSGRPDQIIAGFGVNVNISREQFPRELDTIATSVQIESGRAHDPGELLMQILTGFDRHARADQNLVHDRYCSRLYGPGRLVVAQGVRGVFDRVLIDGRLCVRADGGERIVSSGPMLFADA